MIGLLEECSYIKNILDSFKSIGFELEKIQIDDKTMFMFKSKPIEKIGVFIDEKIKDIIEEYNSNANDIISGFYNFDNNSYIYNLMKDYYLLTIEDFNIVSNKIIHENSITKPIVLDSEFKEKKNEYKNKFLSIMSNPRNIDLIYSGIYTSDDYINCIGEALNLVNEKDPKKRCEAVKKKYGEGSIFKSNCEDCEQCIEDILKIL